MLGVYGVFRGYFVGECWVFTECFVVISWVFVALLTIRSQRNGRLSAAVGTDLSCPCIRVRHTFVKRWGHICNPFETHSRNVRNVFVICVLHIRRVKVWFLRCKSMVFGVQKLPFWLTKTTFLAYKNHLFDLQKVGFYIFVKYISIFIDINKEYERTYNKFIKMVYNSLKRQSCHCVLYIFYI